MFWRTQSKKESLEESVPSLEAPPLQAEAMQPSAPPSALVRTGTCRICFEEGGELIAPCLCKGSSKWIHRDCLNHWRVSGSNPRALTNCCECGFQYHMRLERIISGDGESRRRAFLRRLAGQTLMTFLGVQLLIVGLGILLRLADQEEWLVKFFGFPQDNGYKDLHSGTFGEAIQHHKLTYYVSGILAFFLIVGTAASVAALASCCFGFRAGAAPLAPPPDMSDVICCELCCRCCCEATAVTCDCGYCCTDCCAACCRPAEVCRECPSPVTVGADVGEAFVILFIVAAVAAIVVGIFTCVVLMVSAAQEALKKYATLQEMRILSQEYIVEDLADPMDLGETQVKPKELTTEQRVAERQINQDLVFVFGESRPSDRSLFSARAPTTGGATLYGSTRH